MKILSAEQIRALDKYTIEHEPIASIDLMERAALHFTEAILPLIDEDDRLFIFCGMGNNGGDGLAVARMLIERGFQHISTFVLAHMAKGSSDFAENEARIKLLTTINYISDKSQIPILTKGNLCIDAIFGSGLSRPVDGFVKEVITAINSSPTPVYSIDVPSGLFCDKLNSTGDVVIHSTHTFTFHTPKLSFLFPQNEKHVPAFTVLDIGLSKAGEDTLDTSFEYLDESFIKPLFRTRSKFSHKGSYGHALICAGSYGKMGAAVLSVGAALRSGAGLVSAFIPKCGYGIMQTAHPEAMVYTDVKEHFLSQAGDFKKFSAIGCGPGIGNEALTFEFVESLLKHNDQPMVLDADALNMIAAYPHLKDFLNPQTILTPHPVEFKRLAGEWSNDWEKLHKQIDFSKKYNVVIVLKGAHTSISTPAGKVYFNSTGNPGMAKGGSGDVLTGILTSLLAQGYSTTEAAIIGVFVHGWAGDYAAAQFGETAMTAGDIIHALPQAFLEFESH